MCAFDETQFSETWIFFKYEMCEAELHQTASTFTAGDWNITVYSEILLTSSSQTLMSCSGSHVLITHVITSLLLTPSTRITAALLFFFKVWSFQADLQLLPSFMDSTSGDEELTAVIAALLFDLKLLTVFVTSPDVKRFTLLHCITNCIPCRFFFFLVQRTSD